MKPSGFLPRSSPVALAVAIGGCAALLSGCAVGPNYHPPAPPAAPLTPQPLPAATQPAGGLAQRFNPGADIEGDWWTLFRSPQLDALIASALAHNPTLQEAQATLVQAQETARAEQGVLVPSVSGGFTAQRDQISAAELASSGVSAGGASIPPYTLYNASLSVSYTLDVFGGERRQIESDLAQAEYERWELEASYLSLTANIVTAAVNEASLRGQIEATQALIADEQKLLGLLQTQFSLGGVAKAQLLEQQATLAQEQATLPPLESQLAQAQNQLAAYAGALPGDFHEASFSLDDLTLPADLPVSLPSAVVAQRPDIRAAAAQLHEAAANVGVADANMLPQITLTGGIGHESLTTGTLFTPQTLMWNLVGGLTQPIFEGGQLSAKRQAALAALRGAGASYQAAVITGFQNVADALSALQYDAIALQAAQAAQDAASASLQVTQAQYRLGGQPFSNVLTAEVTEQTALIATVKARAARLSDTAALYQALGGGWWHRQDVAQTCCGIIP